MIWSRCQKSYSDGSLVGAGGGVVSFFRLELSGLRCQDASNFYKFFLST